MKPIYVPYPPRASGLGYYAGCGGAANVIP